MTNQVHSLADHQQVPRAERIARLNDALRKSGQGGTIMVTPGVRALPGFNVEELLQMLATYDKFDEDNDPHGEHDLGDIEWADGTTILFKLDYYDLEYAYHSPDPANPDVTNRVLTLLLQSEW